MILRIEKQKRRTEANEIKELNTLKSHDKRKEKYVKKQEKAKKKRNIG